MTLANQVAGADGAIHVSPFQIYSINITEVS